MKRIAVFVDVQNIYYTCRHTFGRQFNYRRLWQQLNLEGELVQAVAYATDKGDDGQRKFQDALKHIGFDVKLKPYIQRADGSAKGDWDVGITIDVLDAAPNVDTIVLLSGDGDFDLLLKKVELYGCETQVFGVSELTANALIMAATKFIAIDDTMLL
ncbi:LabA-like NYN domain-containing protein [Ferrimonas aestuarii]|uniref:NYN domain-containing protein n=1 Tax=Ferrimonas aestuarii TaxID=2569539 RepID=A0A4U1BQ27_9GAMM|nr:NYN domain-containing protein [Ferrimonas aestuarii]TKB56506.1 NYN domain-containing protein [Ferrimonas aestuarii]